MAAEPGTGPFRSTTLVRGYIVTGQLARDQNGRLRIAALGVRAREGRDVTAAVLRKVPFERLIAVAHRALALRRP